MFLGALVLIILSVYLTTDVELKKETATEEENLSNMICKIEGIESAQIEYYLHSENEKVIEGIAVIYQGSSSAATRLKIYELIRALYGISYNRIYVSGES